MTNPRRRIIRPRPSPTNRRFRRFQSRQPPESDRRSFAWPRSWPELWQLIRRHSRRLCRSLIRLLRRLTARLLSRLSEVIDEPIPSAA
jgi:hypothetical protein